MGSAFAFSERAKRESGERAHGHAIVLADDAVTSARPA